MISFSFHINPSNKSGAPAALATLHLEPAVVCSSLPLLLAAQGQGISFASQKDVGGQEKERTKGDMTKKD